MVSVKERQDKEQRQSLSGQTCYEHQVEKSPQICADWDHKSRVLITLLWMVIGGGQCQEGCDLGTGSFLLTR